MTVEIKGLGKVTANKDVLNTLSLFAGAYYERECEKNHDALAEWGYEAQDAIYTALQNEGYYN